MNTGVQTILAAIARFYLPIIMLFAASLLAARAPGEGISFVAGLILGLSLALHALVFGAAISRVALPPWLLLALLGGGLLASIAPGVWVHSRWMVQLGEAGLMVSTAAGSALVFMALIGRAPTITSEQW